MRKVRFQLQRKLRQSTSKGNEFSARVSVSEISGPDFRKTLRKSLQMHCNAGKSWCLDINRLKIPGFPSKPITDWSYSAIIKNGWFTKTDCSLIIHCTIKVYGSRLTILCTIYGSVYDYSVSIYGLFMINIISLNWNFNGSHCHDWQKCLVLRNPSFCLFRLCL